MATEKIPVGHRIGKAIGFVLRPVTWPYGLWWQFRRRDGTTFFVMPDTFALLLVMVATGTFFPPLLWRYMWAVPAVVFIAPFMMLSVLRIRRGEVTHFKTFLLVPYWRSRVPAGSQFDLYDAWEDPAPSGVAFTLPPCAGEYLHLGTPGNAQALYQAVFEALKTQGWRNGPLDSLTR